MDSLIVATLADVIAAALLLLGLGVYSLIHDRPNFRLARDRESR